MAARKKKLEKPALIVSVQEQERLDATVRQSLELGTAISATQERLREMFLLQERLKERLATVIEIVCEDHGAKSSEVRGDWNGEHFVLSRALS